MPQQCELSQTDLLAKYRHLRNVARELNDKIVTAMPGNAIEWAGAELGIRRNKVLVFSCESEISLVMDCCFFDYVRDGKTVVQQYLAKSKKRLSPDELTIIRAMTAARFSVFAVADVTPGLGVTLHDTLRDDRIFVVDIGLGSSAPMGGLMAGRLISPDGITMTTGAVQRVTTGAIDAIRDQIDDLLPGGTVDLSKLSPGQRSRFAVGVIRACLENGGSTRIRYTEPGELYGSSSAKVGRNLPPEVRREDRSDLLAGGQPSKSGVVRSFLRALLPAKRKA